MTSNAGGSSIGEVISSHTNYKTYKQIGVGTICRILSIAPNENPANKFGRTCVRLKTTY